MPLATELRPKILADFIGQEKLVGKNGPIRKLIEINNIPSMIFWGPPGVGKTTLAEIISHAVSAEFLSLSAVSSGKDALRNIITRARLNLESHKKTILFIDEIHRWNKAQQDALLPYVESGVLILIGATTENPSFSIISPLLSRSRVFVFEQLSSSEIRLGLQRGSEYLKIKVDDKTIAALAEISNGDLRFALNSLEIAANISKGRKITPEDLNRAINKHLKYDKTGDEHYNIISAVHKSLRSSNATAGIYWITRMLKAGDDPLYIARRLIRFASEDIGNANPNALLLANVVYDTCHKIGMPECGVALVQLAEYLAKSPKNNSAYIASKMAEEDINNYGNLEVPLNIRNAPTKLMKELGYGKNYEYDHDLSNKKSDQQCLPDELKDRNYFN